MLSRRTAGFVTVVAALAVAAAIAVPLLSEDGQSSGERRSPLQTTDSVSGLVLEPLGDGAPIEFDSLRGKPIVLNSFASTCPPCIEEMPRLEKLHQELGGKVVFVGMDVFDYEPAALELVQKTGVTYLVGADPRAEIHVAIGGLRLPTTWFIDERGRIVEKHTGEIGERELRSRIRAHFSV